MTDKTAHPLLIKPSDLRAEAQRLIAAGEMPTLEKLLDVVAEVRQTYKPQIEANRRAGEYPLLDEMNRLGERKRQRQHDQ